MKFKIGIGLLLCGVILSNGAVYNGWYFLAALVVGGIGLLLVMASSGDNDNANANVNDNDYNSGDDQEQK